MKGETRHKHNGKIFFINESKDGVLLVTMNSMVEDAIKEILYHYLHEDEVQECCESLTLGIELILIENSDSYVELLKYKPKHNAEERFLQQLKKAIDTGVECFRVPVYDPSIDESSGELKFIPDCRPATGYSYPELEELAKDNGVKLGTLDQYTIYGADTIFKLMEEDYTMEDAFYEVCVDSKNLGHFSNSADAKNEFELTGSRMVAGKCDRGNTFKILKKDEKAGGFWIAGGVYNSYSKTSSITSHNLCVSYNFRTDYGVGWYVF